MSPPLRPLPGDPGAVRALARSLRATGERLDAIGSTLGRLRAGATWEGCANEAFTARIGDVPPLVATVAERFAGAAAPLTALAEVMEEAQGVIGTAVHDDDAAAHAYAVLEDRVALLVASGRGEDDPEVVVLRHLQREQVAEQVRARARHAAALERFREADARAASVLRGLALDDIADSRLYRTLAAVQAGGRGVAEVGALAVVAPELAPLAAAGDATAVVADAGMLAVYGEGDAGALATGLALASTGGVGRVLRQGSLLGAEATAAGVRATRSLTTQQRLALGAVEAARARRDALRASLRGVPAAVDAECPPRWSAGARPLPPGDGDRGAASRGCRTARGRAGARGGGRPGAPARPRRLAARIGERGRGPADVRLRGDPRGDGSRRDARGRPRTGRAGPAR